ncbi:PAS domain S-box protein [Magnetovibrio sp. PR-2]|uniref:PAS domain S-box protein n=1 Tax=Magnetovibrio sp. PR-2 TaxID=3120356 RepID=UPI002FCE2C26
MKLTSKTLILFVSVLLLTAVGIGGISSYVHYTSSVNTHLKRLIELAASRARIIEAIAQHDKTFAQQFGLPTHVGRKHTLSQIIDAHNRFEGFGETGEFTLAELKGDNIVFLLKHRHKVAGVGSIVNWEQGVAEPMKAALSGQSGTMIGQDYRGVEVIAAFEPVKLLDLGLVAKIDLAEIRTPIIRELLWVYALGLAVVVLGSLILYRVSLRFFSRLEYREARYESIISDHPEMICRFKPDGQLSYANRYYADTFGFAPQAVQVMSVFDLMPQNEHIGFRQMIANFTSEHPVIEHENMAINARGDLIWTSWTNRGFFNANGELIEVQSAGTDVTQQKAEYLRNLAMSQLALDAQEMDETELLQSALEWCENLTNSTISFFHFINDDQETIQLIAWSKHTLAAYCHVEELDGHYPISAAGIWADAFRNLAPTVINDYTTAPNKKGLPDGHAHLERLISLPMFEAGKIVALLGVGNKATHYTDADVENLQILADYVWSIASRKRAQSKLHELESVVNRSPAVAFVWGTTQNWAVEYVSENVSQWGYSPEDFYGGGVSYADLIHEQDLEGVQAKWSTQNPSEGALKTYSYRLVDRDGQVRWVDERSWPILDEHGNVKNYQGVVLDITERQEAEQQLWQMQKAESLGTLAGGIAHDINNLMLPIVALSEMTIDDFPEDHRGRTRLEKIHEAGIRAKKLVEKILAFSHKSDRPDETYDLNVVAQEAFDLFKSTVPTTIDFEGRLFSEPLMARGDPTEFHTVLINMVSNSIDAIEGTGGKIRITLDIIVANEKLEQALPQIKRHHNYARILVEDNGEGMSAEKLERIFDPFYTTKVVGQGTGLGLALVFNVVEKSQGGIKVSSTPGEGTVFEIYLPLVDGGKET